MTDRAALSTPSWTNANAVRAIVTRPLAYWGVLIAVFVVARVATWGFPFDSDHWIFFYVGRNWIVEGGDLYVDAWDHKPPMIFLMNGIMAALFGDNLVLHRIWLTAFTVLDCWLFFLLVKRVLPPMLDRVDAAQRIDRTVAVRLTLLGYVFFRNLSQFTNSGNNTEAFGVILVLLMVLAYLKFTETDGLRWLALAGLACGVLFWFKGNFLIFGAIIGVLLLFHGWRAKGRLALQVLVYVAPIILVALGWCAYFAAQGTFDDFWLASFGFSAKYATSAWAGKVSANILLIATTAALLVPALVFFAVYLRDAKTQWREHSYHMIGWMFLSGLVLIGAVGSFYAYYLLVTMPFTVLVIMYGMLRVSSFGPVVRWVLIVGFILTLLVNSAISGRQLLNSFSGSAHQDAVDKQHAAEFIDERTETDDRIVSYDYGATFYILADRRAPSRFISASVLLLDSRDGYGLGFNDEFIEGIERHEVQYVMLSGENRELYASNTQVNDFLVRNFATVATFGGVDVLERIAP